MRLRRGIRLSVRALLAHRLRTALALGSVGVGVAGVLLTGAVGAGAEAEIRRDVESAGSNLLVVRPAQVKRSPARQAVKGVVSTLRLEDYEAIAGLPLAAEAAPVVDATLRVKAEQRSMGASVIGSSAALGRLRNLATASGRFLDAEDEAAARRVAVLGSRVAASLFPDGNGVGQEVRVRGLPFEVIGVLEARGIEADGSDQDGNVFIPVRTALRRVFNTTRLTGVWVRVEDVRRMGDAQAAMAGLLRERHRLAPGAADDFAVQDQMKVLALQQAAVRSLTWLTGGLAGLAMVVGGAGIFALLYLSVKERTAEIGLRMAVGARPFDVLLQFLGEAALLALGGWGAGALVAVLGVAVVALATEWPVALPVDAALASLAMAVVTGLGFGALPARKAARLPPIQALRTAF